MAQLVKNLPAMWETWVRSLGWEDSPGETKGYPLQNSDLENPMDYTVHGVAKCQTQLRDLHFKQVKKRVTFVHDPSAHVLNTETF